MLKSFDFSKFIEPTVEILYEAGHEMKIHEIE